jgi:hypothetical protein
MNSANAPLVNRLILLVLSLILVCLVMLVIRAYQGPVPPGLPAEVTEAQTTADELVPAPAVTPPVRLTEPPRRTSPTNTVRLVAASRPVSLPQSAPEPENIEPVEPPAAASIAHFESVVAVRGATPTAGVRDGHASAGQPGEITGIVTLSGTPKPEIPIDMGPTCGYHFSEQRTTRHFVVGPNGGLANVLVYVRSAENVTARLAKSQEVPLLDQVGCMYEPYVMGVLVGQKFRVRNSDPVLHNVHATPRSNHEFNFGQPVQGQVNERSFNRPELFIRVKCDVHPWMFAYVSAVAHPFFAVTDTNGFFRLPAGLPSGGYTVTAVHLKSGEITKRTSLQDERPGTLDFQFTVPSATQPQGRIARAE